MNDPSTSAAIPSSLRLADLPERPRPISLAMKLAVATSWPLARAGLLMLVPCVVTSIVDLGDGEHPKWAVTAHITLDGVDRSLTSYINTRAPAVGDNVVVVGDDDHLALRGALLRERDPFLLYFVCLQLFLCLGIVVAAARPALKRLALLRDGDVGRGKLVAKDEDTSGDNPVWVLTYEFVDASNGQRRTHVERTGRAHEHLIDDVGGEPLLYDDHSTALLDALPGQPQLVGGRFVPRQPARAAAWAGLAVVAVVTAPVGAAAMWWLALR